MRRFKILMSTHFQQWRHRWLRLIAAALVRRLCCGHLMARATLCMTWHFCWRFTLKIGPCHGKRCPGAKRGPGDVILASNDSWVTVAIPTLALRHRTIFWKWQTCAALNTSITQFTPEHLPLYFSTWDQLACILPAINQVKQPCAWCLTVLGKLLTHKFIIVSK